MSAWHWYMVSLLLTLVCWLVKPSHLVSLWVAGRNFLGQAGSFVARHYSACLLTLIAVETTIIVLLLASR